MNRFVVGILALLASAPALLADDPRKSEEKEKSAAKEEKKPTTSADEYKAIIAEVTKARQDFNREFRQAKTDEERTKVVKDKYPEPAKFAGKMMGLAKKYPKDAAAVDALVWLMTNVREGTEADQALELLLKGHMDSPRLGDVALSLAYSRSTQTENQLRTLLNKSPHKDVQGKACYALGMYLKRTGHVEEAESQLERVVKEFGGLKVRGDTIGAMAKGELFEMRFLVIGKTAPDIAGDDVDGKPFHLTDYRGKVVVLDFWGHW
jgi:hypothetical protein